MSGSGERYYQKVLTYYTVFTSPKGKEVLHDLERSYRHTFDPDPYKSAFFQGRRQVVLDIQRMIELAQDPEFNASTVASQFDLGGDEEEDNG